MIDRRLHNADDKSLSEQMADLVLAGAEGLVIRDRDGIDWKLKPIEDDDAEVVDYTAGTGRNSARLGALVVRDRAGRQFKIGNGLSDELRDSPPAKGSIARFSFEGRTKYGIPRFARFIGQRAEISFA